MANEFKKDDFFKIDPECHMVGDSSPWEYFPGVQQWWRAIDQVKRPMTLGMRPEWMEGLEPHELVKQKDPEYLLMFMDKYGVDVACLLPESMADATGHAGRFCSNGEMGKAVDRHPDRFLYEPNLSPIKKRGLKNTLWELEYWVKERGAKIFKYYPPEDTYINDPDLWPFYKRAEELGIILDIHTGMSWVPPGKSKYSLPIQIDDVARDFPELKIVAFHMGYPYCDELNMVAMGHPNVYPCLSLLAPWGLLQPRKFAKILGEALRFAGPDKIIWGTDTPGFGFQVKFSVLGFRDFQIPEDMQEGYGYPAITDEIRRKIFGENLGRLLGIDTTTRRVKV